MRVVLRCAYDLDYVVMDAEEFLARAEEVRRSG